MLLLFQMLKCDRWISDIISTVSTGIMFIHPPSSTVHSILRKSKDAFVSLIAVYYSLLLFGIAALFNFLEGIRDASSTWNGHFSLADLRFFHKSFIILFFPFTILKCLKALNATSHKCSVT